MEKKTFYLTCERIWIYDTLIFAAGILLLALVILELSRIPAKSAEGSLETVPSDFDDRSQLC